MLTSVIRSLFLAAPIAVLALPMALAQDVSSVKLIKSVNLPGYTGDFDHFAVDYDRNRLLLAAEDHGTLEVFDLKTSAHLRTITGFGNPHSILADRCFTTKRTARPKRRDWRPPQSDTTTTIQTDERFFIYHSLRLHSGNRMMGTLFPRPFPQS